MTDQGDSRIYSAPSVLLGFLLGGILVGLSSSAIAIYPEPPPPPLERSQYDEHLLMLDREAIELAYQEQVQNLFLTWMKDPTGQPNRALTGIRRAAKAYVESMDGAKRREEEIKKNPQK